MRNYEYSEIRGFNYSTGYKTPKDQLKREFGYAKRIGLNSVRIWLFEEDYEKNREEFLNQLGEFVSVCREMELSVMMILFNGNLLDPRSIERDAWEKQERYVEEVIGSFAGNPAILMWDLMNEPACNDYILKSQGDQRAQRWDKMLCFLKHHASRIKEKFPEEILTIGHMRITDVEDHIELVDVISFHDYSPTRSQIDRSYQKAMELSEQWSKPILNSEMCCLCRGNPYDVALEKAYEYKTGWYLFELMIDGYWGDIHGVFYPDGTVRDPSIAAAAMGIFRKREKDVVAVTPNKEGHAAAAVAMVRDALTDSTESFRYAAKPIETVLEAAEYCANLLEACELIPMNLPPSARIQRIREAGDLRAARKLAYELAEQLRKACLLLPPE